MEPVKWQLIQPRQSNKQVFPGGIEAAMGMSYGGLIAQYLATDFRGLVPKYVFVVTAYRCSSVVAEADMRFAQFLAAGRNGRAFYEVFLRISPTK